MRFASRAFALALALAAACSLQPVQAVTRQVYVAANQVWWDFSPSGENRCAGGPYDDATGLYAVQGLGSRYMKALYQEYQDGSFKALKVRDQDEVHLGLIGPIIYATPDDIVQVVLRNNLDFPINMVPSGAVTNDTSALERNATKAYTWTIPAEAAPDSRAVHSSRPYIYRSTVDQVSHANAGLVGLTVVTRSADARPHGQPADVDRELFTLFQVMNENESPLLNKTRAAAGWKNATGPLSADDFKESNKKHQMNGFVFCNAPGMNAPLGQKVRWYVMVEGNEVDMHNAHWHGNVLLRDGHRVDQFSLLPGSAQVLDMVPDNPGSWLFHCHVNDHILAGMMSLYTVANANGTAGPPVPALPTQGAGAGAVREYFIAALEGVWDYAPSGTNNCGGKPADFDDAAKGFVVASGSGLGRRHIKAQYVEFTDASFTKRKERAPEDAYLGILGPVIRATVGDTIRLTFKNGVPHNTTVHPHGVLYPKDAEGAIYNDGTSGRDKMDDIIPPGSNWTFVWQVTERAGPGPRDPSSLLWMYHSHFDEVADTNAGLSGPIIISRKEASLPSGAPNDVDREFVLSYAIQDEVKSFYFAKNLAQLGSALTNDQQATLTANSDDAANEHFHSINGMLYCNLPHLAAKQGERVRLHIFALGTENGIHAPAISASNLDWEGSRREAAQLIPGSMRSMDVFLVQPGPWTVQCRTANHYADGMTATIDVAPNGLAAAAPAGAPVRTYYIAAERSSWNFAPQGLVDRCTSEKLADEQLLYADPSGAGLGSVYVKGLYREYTDASFRTRKPANPQHGILGPTLHAHVGDTLNKLPFNANLQLGAGLVPLNGTAYDEVAPNATMTLAWTVPASAGPSAADGAAVAYTYYSSVDPQAHENAGLIGALIVSSQGTAEPDVEVPLLFNIQNENLSAFLDANVKAANHTVNTTSDDFVESMKKHSVNGYLFCQQPPVVVQQNQEVRLILIGVGGETDMHTPIFTDSLLVSPGVTASTRTLLPGSVRVVELTTDMPGRFEFHCNVQDHYKAGMKGILEVQPKVGVLAQGQLPHWRRRALA
ncbi:hypothetical protein WJX81_003935 [Elliptochloris bilobata]|uniref:Uncharacterized protein n=1 Tax=Elliptochloris bilobata TaxID=381761 RepID=A0AAW1S6B6_9CHLO